MAMEEVRKRLTIETASSGLDGTAAGINKVADAEARLTVESQKSERAQLSMEGAFAKLERRYVDGVRQQQELAKVQQQVNAAVAQNPALQDRANAVLAGATQRLNAVNTANQNVAKSTGLARHEMINLSRQAQDVGVSLASGQSPFTVLIQQGSQIADVFASSTGSVRGFFSQAIGWAGRFATSAAGVATGVGAIAGAALYAATSWSTGQREIDKALIGIGQRSGATVDSINKIAEASAGSSRLSISESRTAALEFVKTGNIYTENIGALVGLVKGHAIAIGESSEEAAKQLAKIFGGDIAEGADKLNAVYGSISGATRQYAVELDILGKRQEAIALLAKQVAPAIQRASDVTGFWAKSWDVVSNTSSNAFDKIGKGLANLTGVGLSREDRLGNAQNALKIGETGLRDQQELAAIIGPELVPGLKQAQQAVEKLREEVARLNKEIEGGTASTDESRLLKIGQDADTAVRSLVPFIEQLEKVAKAQELIKKAQAAPGAQQGLAGSNAEAARAAEVLTMNIKNTREETDRANKVALELAKTYGTGSIEIAKARAALADQLVVASAVGGQARLAAQEQATYNELIRQGKTAHDAAAVAADQRAVAQAQINTQAKEQLVSLQNQLPVVSAIGGAARLAAQEQATYNQLVHQGVSSEIAQQVAAQERVNAQAQINARASENLAIMVSQRGVAEAVTGEERIRAQAQATYNQLVLQGVDARIASATAAEQERQAIAQVNAQIENQVHALEQSTELIYARMNGTEATVKAEQAYENALRAGADAAAASAIQAATLANERAKANEKAAREIEREAVAWERVRQENQRILEISKFVPFAVRDIRDAVGALAYTLGKDLFEGKQGYTQFDPKGYKFGEPTAQAFQAEMFGGQKNVQVIKSPYGAEFDQIIPTAGGYEYQIDRGLAGGKALPGVIDDLLNRKFTTNTMNGGAVFDTALGQTLARLTNLLPDADKIGVIERELLSLSKEPATIARDELVKQLMDQLKQLRESVEGNTDALNAQLDPLFSQGHEYLNNLRIGYYKAASGFDGIARGGIPGVDSIPFKAMVQDGERITITPRGGWSGNTSNVSNDNSKNVTQNITQNINLVSQNASPLTARQMAQGFVAAAARAVA